MVMESKEQMVFARDMTKDSVKAYFETIKKKNPSFYRNLSIRLNKDAAAGIRKDVLRFFSENMDVIDGNDEFLYYLETFSGNACISPEWFEWILSYFKREDAIEIADFSLLLMQAVEKGIALSALQEIMADCGNDLVEIFRRMEEKADPVDREEPITAEWDQAGTANPDKVSAGQSVPSGTAEEERRMPEAASDMEILGNLMTAVTKKEVWEQNPIHDVQDSFNRMTSALQSNVTEVSSFFTKTFRMWEKDKEEIERLKALYSILQRVMETQTQKMNLMRNENARLTARLHEMEVSEMKRQTINEKITELQRLALRTEQELSIGMTPDMV